LSGEVDDREIVKIGNQLGANYVVTGQITFSGEAYRLRVFAIDIEKGQRVASSSLNISSNDRQINHFITSRNQHEQTLAVQQRETADYQGHPLYRTRQGVEHVLVGFFWNELFFTSFHYIDKTFYDRFIDEIKREFRLNNITANDEITIRKTSSQRCKDVFTSMALVGSQADLEVFYERKGPGNYRLNEEWVVIFGDSGDHNYFNLSVILLTDKI